MPHQLNGYILLKARYKRHIAFASGTGNTIAMANRRCDFRSFCGATERIRNAGAKCLEEPQWAGVSTPSVAITSVLTWHYPLLVPDFKPQPSPEPEPDPDPSPDCRPPQDGPDKRCYLFRICLPAPFLFMFGRRQFSWRWMQLSCVGLLVAASFPGQQIWRIPASAYPRDFGFAFCPYSLPRLVLQPGGK